MLQAQIERARGGSQCSGTHVRVQVLSRNGRVSDTCYERAEEALGSKAVVELVSIVGYYTYVAFTLNTFEIEP